MVSLPRTPTRYAIASHWASVDLRTLIRATPKIGFVMDIGEPSCFACGFYRERWDRLRGTATRWNKSDLQRAHIIGRAQGGGNRVDNYLLLCGECHRDAPMTLDHSSMVSWCANRESFHSRQTRAFTNALSSVGLNCEMLSKHLDANRLTDFFRYARQHAGQHFGYSINPATWAALLKTYLASHGEAIAA